MYAAACDDLNDTRNLQHTTRGRLNEIDIRWPDLHITCDVLLNILVSKSSNNLKINAIRKLLYELQKSLKIFVISANPQNQDRLRLFEERRELQIVLRLTKLQDVFEIFDLLNCRIRDIIHVLIEYESTILHFNDHGDSKRLCFEDEFHTAQIVKKVALTNFFK